MTCLSKEANCSAAGKCLLSRHPEPSSKTELPVLISHAGCIIFPICSFLSRIPDATQEPSVSKRAPRPGPPLTLRHRHAGREEDVRVGSSRRSVRRHRTGGLRGTPESCRGAGLTPLQRWGVRSTGRHVHSTQLPFCHCFLRDKGTHARARPVPGVSVACVCGGGVTESGNEQSPEHGGPKEGRQDLCATRFGESSSTAKPRGSDRVAFPTARRQ